MPSEHDTIPQFRRKEGKKESAQAKEEENERECKRE